jgi:Mg-chelatase subunit ChlD
MPKALVVNKENVVPKETYYLLIVDASSSMGPLTKSTISGVNEQIDSIKQLEKEFPEQKYNMSFMHFNNTVTIEYTDRQSSALEHISETNYKCSGMTALLDAIGVGVRNLNEKIGDKIASGEASAVVVIITDGEENASREFDGSKVKSMIEELQATNRWTFTFVGANIDSISTASRYGIDVKNVMQFSGDELSNKKVYASMTKSFKSRAMAMDSGISYQADTFLSDEDKDVTSK